MKAQYDPTETGLQGLPPEIKIMILEFLDARSKLALSQTNCGWRDLILDLTDTEEITNTLFRLDKKRHHQAIIQMMSGRVTASSIAKLFEELLCISIPSAYVLLIFTSKRHIVLLIEILSVILLFAALTSLAHDLVDYFIESDTKAEKQYAHRRAFQFFAQPSQSTAQKTSEEEEDNLSADSKYSQQTY
ncbi:TPA: F-box protein [Legionella pneumophila]|nr:F-box protein [Legionella pneumophila]